MEYSEAIDFLFNQLPAFEVQGAGAYKPGLQTAYTLSAAFGDPHHDFRSIHVAGTNGKGSTTHMLASVLMEAGYKVGIYTSPHLYDFRERIRVDGEMIDELSVIDFVERYRELELDCSPTFFELTTIMAFEYFSRQGVDIAVVETGLGGRLDTTNIITPLVSVITNVSLDHMAQLGDTVEQIAAEKAGIIKPGVPVVIGEVGTIPRELDGPGTALPPVGRCTGLTDRPGTAPLPGGRCTELTDRAGTAPLPGGVREVFERKAAEVDAPIVFADQLSPSPSTLSMVSGRDSASSPIDGYTTDLTGDFQQKNIRTVLAAIDIMRDRVAGLSPQVVARGLSRVKANTHLMGRWEERDIDGRHVIMDPGHNAGAWQYTAPRLQHLAANGELWIVLGFSSDKDITDIMASLPVNAHYVFVKSKTKRGRDASDLLQIAEKRGLAGHAFASVTEGVDYALSASSPGSTIFIGGSFYVLAELPLDRV